MTKPKNFHKKILIFLLALLVLFIKFFGAKGILAWLLSLAGLFALILVINKCFDFLENKKNNQKSEVQKTESLSEGNHPEENAGSEIENEGWLAIEKEFLRAYPGQTDPRHYGTLVKWKFGGNDPLDGISIYDGGNYWHFVSFGLSELYEKESENKEISGYGYELTFKLKKDKYEDEEAEIKNGCAILQGIARLVFNGEIFTANEYIYTGQTEGIDSKRKSRLTGLIIVKDPTVQTIETPNGKVQFLELIGMTDEELKTLSTHASVEEIYKKLGSDITDFNRKSLIQKEYPHKDVKITGTNTYIDVLIEGRTVRIQGEMIKGGFICHKKTLTNWLEPDNSPLTEAEKEKIIRIIKEKTAGSHMQILFDEEIEEKDASCAIDKDKITSDIVSSIVEQLSQRFSGTLIQKIFFEIGEFWNEKDEECADFHVVIASKEDCEEAGESKENPGEYITEDDRNCIRCHDFEPLKKLGIEYSDAVEIAKNVVKALEREIRAADYLDLKTTED
ncbi:MAG: suppressor of fused domain protein, partial [Treponema sp.]|nr:suppressor of fused domain protein [Treponema sp.]